MPISMLEFRKHCGRRDFALISPRYPIGKIAKFMWTQFPYDRVNSVYRNHRYGNIAKMLRWSDTIKSTLIDIQKNTELRRHPEKARQMRSKELVICGMKAVRSRFETNSDSVLRLFFNRASSVHVGDLCRWMARERLVYRCVESEELERISGSVHHGGIVVIVESPELRAPEYEELREWAERGEQLLLLDRISNVHNLGAIIRSAAFFGVTKVVIPDHPLAAIPTEATYRVAEGGLEHVEVYCVGELSRFIEALRPFYRVVGAATRGGDAAGAAGTSSRPLALVMGNEEQGLTPDVAAACHTLVTIPGSGRVESLNVAATAAILLWEYRKSPNRHNPSSDRPNPPSRRPSF